MASAVGEDRGWGMSEAVPAQVRVQLTGLWPPPYTHTRIYRARLCQQLDCRNGWAVRQRLTSTSERMKRFLLVWRSFDIFLQPSSPSALFHRHVWSGSVPRLRFKVTSEVGQHGSGAEIREIRLDLRLSLAFVAV